MDSSKIYPNITLKKRKRRAKEEPYIKNVDLYTLKKIDCPWIKIECYQLRKIKSKNSIILLYIINTNTLGNPNKSTLIYSHSNKGLRHLFSISY